LAVIADADEPVAVGDDDCGALAVAPALELAVASAGVNVALADGVATALGLTYVLLAVAHLQLVAPAHRVALSAAAGASALGAGLIRVAIARIPATLLPRAPDLLDFLHPLSMKDAA
jgi:hypothetical protein